MLLLLGEPLGGMSLGQGSKVVLLSLQAGRTSSNRVESQAAGVAHVGKLPRDTAIKEGYLSSRGLQAVSL